MFGLHDTKWDQSARWASGASCGGLIISLHYQAGAGCQMGWANHGVKVPKGNKVPGSETKYVEIYLALHVCASSPLVHPANQLPGTQAACQAESATQSVELRPDVLETIIQNATGSIAILLWPCMTPLQVPSSPLPSPPFASASSTHLGKLRPLLPVGGGVLGPTIFIQPLFLLIGQRYRLLPLLLRAHQLQVVLEVSQSPANLSK